MRRFRGLWNLVHVVLSVSHDGWEACDEMDVSRGLDCAVENYHAAEGINEFY